MNAPKTLPLAAALAALFLIHLPGRAAEPQIDYDRHALAGETSARQELAPRTSEQEQIRHKLIHQAYQETAGAGTWSVFSSTSLMVFLNVQSELFSACSLSRSAASAGA